jgi:hypothetical protein
MPAGGAALKGVHPLCCERCGDVSQPGISEQSAASLQLNTMSADFVVAIRRDMPMLRQARIAAVPFFDDSSPPIRSASPLRI